MATASEVITLALKDAGVLGVGQTAMAEDMNDALTTLNNMLAVWKRFSALVFDKIDVSFVGTGALFYTIGAGANINVPRPGRIDAAYARMNAGTANPVDYPLIIIQSAEDYSKISVKELQTAPNAVYYEPAYPVGKVYVWPQPDSQYEIHLIIKQDIPLITNLVANVVLPDEYFEPIRWNLAVRLRVMYRKAADPQLSALAKASLNDLRRINAAIPTMDLPTPVVKYPAGGGYNIYSDQ